MAIINKKIPISVSQSYILLLLIPFQGMLYDTYQSYKAAFCFAVVPEIIGLLMMFLIPFSTQSQVNYRREIDLSSNSGILVGENVAINNSPDPVSENAIAQEPMGNYNIIINLPVPAAPSDVRLVNVIIKKIPSCVEASADFQTSNHNQMVDQLENAEPTSESTCDAINCVPSTASNTTIVAPEYVSPPVKDGNTECIQPSSRIDQNVIASVQINQLSQDGFGPSLNTQRSKDAEIFNENETATEGYLSVISDNTNTTSTPAPDTIPLAQNNVLTMPSLQLVEEPILDIPMKSQEDSLKRTDEFLNKDIASLIPQMKTSDKSIVLVNSSIKSNAALGTGANEELETIISLVEETPLPQPTTTTPQPNNLSMRTIGDVKDIEFTAQYNDTPIVNILTATTTASTFSPSLESFVQDHNSCSHDLVFPSEVQIPSVFNCEGTANQNASSLMVSTAMDGTFPLVQDQLPEPLRPTSVCSVRGINVQAASTEVAAANLEKTSASSPLSSELSTVIADVIQSLASQHTATHKPNKESIALSVANDNESSQSRVHAPKRESSSQMGKMDANLVNHNLGCRKESFGSGYVPCDDGSTRFKMQTSVLDSMQSIVAEGCPEDVALLEDISIDLSLDKDPSIASIVFIADKDIPVLQSSFSGHCDANILGRLPSQFSFTQTSQSNQINTPFETTAEDTFSPNNAIFTPNVFSKTLGTPQTIDSSTTVATEAAKSIDPTNPFFSTTT